MNELSSLPEIQMQQLKPFERNPKCPKCTAVAETLLRRLFRRTIRVFPMRYCCGGKPATEEHLAMMGLIKHEHRNVCAGMNQEHLHRFCKNCGYEWLSEVFS